MQKSVKWAFLVAALLVLAVAAAAMSLNQRVIEAGLAARLLEETGLVLQTGSRASFALLPRPQIRIENVHIADASGALQIVTGAVALKGNLRILALLLGKVQFDQIVLVKPSMTVDLDRLAGTRGLAEPTASSGVADPAPDRASRMPGLVIVRDGTLALKSAEAGMDVLFENANFKLDWPGQGGPLAVNGRVHWQDQEFGLSGWLGNANLWLRGGASAATLVLRGNDGRLALRGTLSGGVEGKFTGQIQASIPALSHVLRLAEIAGSFPANVENTEIAGSLAGNRREMEFTGLRLSLLGSQFDGALTFRTGETGTSLSGTLATELLQLSPWVSRLRWNPAAGGADAHWHRLARLMTHWALDLRLSASNVSGAAWHMDDAALAVRAEEGQFSLDLIQARVFGGQVQARASLSGKAAGLAMILQGQAAQIDLGMLCQAVPCPNTLAGEAGLAANLTGQGTSPSGLLQSLAGSAEIHASKLTIEGFDLALALRRIEKHVLPSISNFREGVSAFDQGELILNLGGGKAIVEKCTLTGQATQLQLGGTASLADGQLALKGVAAQTGPDLAAREDGPQLHFKIGGSWNEPSISVQAAGLLPGVGQ